MESGNGLPPPSYFMMATRKRSHAMATRRSSAATNKADNVFIYTVGVEVLKTVTRVRFDPSIRSIPPHTFDGCRDLIEIELNETLHTIGQCAFLNCTSLRSIKIPPNVTSIENHAFEGCTSLSVVELSEALITIGERAFFDCLSLTTIKIPPNVTTIDVQAFDGCFKLREVQLNNVLNTLGPGAFNNCFRLAFIEIPASITIVSESTFYNCISLKMAILNEGTTLIDEEAFRECITLLGITIPSTINSIALDAFMGSTLLRNVSISPASSLTPERFEQSFPTLSSMGISLDMIMHRFDELPLHKYCYDSYPTHAIQPVNNTSSEQFYQDVARLPAHGLQQDCLGMTPLHILACSSNGQGVEIFQCMIEKYPNALRTKDVWGDVPLAYALYAEASIDVICFLFKTHRQMWGTCPLILPMSLKSLPQDLHLWSSCGM